MTAHACATFDPLCWRCDLSRDEMEPCPRDRLADLMELGEGMCGRTGPVDNAEARPVGNAGSSPVGGSDV